jgi:hypothetical protein
VDKRRSEFAQGSSIAGVSFYIMVLLYLPYIFFHMESDIYKYLGEQAIQYLGK